MRILKPHDQSGWITCIIAGRWVQAKVYDEPSSYGVRDCRVSKLTIGKTEHRDPNQNFFDQMDYNYDRGLDFNNLKDPSILETVLTELNNLPKIF